MDNTYFQFWREFRAALVVAGVERDHTPKPLPYFDTTFGGRRNRDAGIRHVFIQNRITGDGVSVGVRVKACQYPEFKPVPLPTTLTQAFSTPLHWWESGAPGFGVSHAFDIDASPEWGPCIAWMVEQNLVFLRHRSTIAALL